MSSQPSNRPSIIQPRWVEKGGSPSDQDTSWKLDTRRFAQLPSPPDIPRPNVLATVLPQRAPRISSQQPSALATDAVVGSVTTNAQLATDEAHLATLSSDVLLELEKSLDDDIARLSREKEADSTPALSSGHKYRAKRPAAGGPPKSRGAARNRLIDDVHKFSLSCLGVQRIRNDPLSKPIVTRLPPPPDNPDGPPPVGIQNFRYAWNRSKSHYYNQAAARNIATAMIDAPDLPYTQKDLRTLQSAFLTYADRTLRKLYDSQYEGPQHPLHDFSQQQTANMQHRKAMLFHHRREILSSQPSLVPYLTTLDRLSIAGMSSDEEDFDSTLGKRYLVAKKPWRAPIVTEFLETIDRFGQAVRTEFRGQGPRVRIRHESRESTSRALPGLPSNAYSDQFLDDLEEWEYDMLEIDEDECDFALPDWVHRYERTNNSSLQQH
ncbi:hypothetical protein FRB99_003642 [Tulasnella sp. 403]|nr:hypothetical protein FRB99_003642 [Tulasnella sp. 403]